MERAQACRHEEQEFLTGLKKDLESDLTEMKGDRDKYSEVAAAMEYFKRVTKGAPLTKDSLGLYESAFFNTTLLNPNNSRFEGLKASGKLSIVQNKELLNTIIDLYQEAIPFVNLNNDWMNDFKRDMIGPYLYRNLDRTPGEIGNWNQLFKTIEVRNILERFDDVPQIIELYDDAIKKAQTIIALIDKEVH